jgi:hypothetical protein
LVRFVGRQGKRLPAVAAQYFDAQIPAGELRQQPARHVTYSNSYIYLTDLSHPTECQLRLRPQIRKPLAPLCIEHYLDHDIASYTVT